MRYRIKNEYINIDNYSPFSLVNGVSECYRKGKFLLPIVNINGTIVPVHPDTFNDLNLDKENILYYIDVFPTASFRTVYYQEKNIFIKLPLMREITRGIRDLPNKELIRSEKAYAILKDINVEHFNILREIVVFNLDERFNYIVRLLPSKNITPLFTIIKKRSYSNSRITLLMKRMIDVWMKLASLGIFLEFHTQNILIDSNDNIYYRDLSDIRSFKYNILPSYNVSEKDLMTLSFDKTFCEQNLDHIFRYYNDLDMKEIITYISKRIKFYKLKFPNYSLTFDKKKKERIPIKVNKTKYRCT